MRSRLIVVLVAVIAYLLLGFPVRSAAATTTDSAATPTYGAQPIARVDVPAIGAVQACSAQVSDTREYSASLSIKPRGTSTTPAARNHATNTATLSGRTVLGGNWDDAIRAGRRAVPEPGFHDVVVHCTPMGIFDDAGNLLSPGEAASVIRSTPSWGGQDIRLLSCSTGCPSGNFAQGLADELGVAVRAPTVDFYVNSRGVPVLDPGGTWITYLAGG